MSENDKTETKVGRPPFEINEQVCKKAEKLASQGLTLHQIAASLGIHYDTLNEKRKAFPEFSEAIEGGKAKGLAIITNSLFQAAQGGDVQAIKYYLNNRDNANWNERKDVNLNASDPISFELHYGTKEQ